MSYQERWGKVVERLDSYQRVNSANLPGAVFGVETHRDGRLITAVGEGWNEKTICALLSMTKPFTSTAVLMALEENGQLDIEMPVHELAGMELYKHDEMKRQIRVRHLLQHTSGLPSFRHYNDGPHTLCKEVSELGMKDSVPWTGSPGMTNEPVFVDGECKLTRQINLDKISEYVMQTYAPTFTPGSDSSYCTYAFTVAGRIVEQLTGKSVNIYLKEKLFDELGMNDSFFIAQATGDQEVDRWMEEGVTQSQRERIAEVKLITQDGKLPPEIASGPDGCWDKFRKGWRYVFPEGGMYSTVEDLLKYLAMLRDGGVSEGKRILSEEIVKLMVEDQGFGHTMAFGYAEKKNRYGQSAGTLSHLGRFMTYMCYEPNRADPVLGVFLSQRLTNLFAMRNLAEGTRVIFQEYIPSIAEFADGGSSPTTYQIAKG